MRAAIQVSAETVPDGMAPRGIVVRSREYPDRIVRHGKRPVAHPLGNQRYAGFEGRNFSSDRPQYSQWAIWEVAVEHQGAGKGVAYVAEDPRQFFLDIESSGVDWKVAVEEGVLGQE